MNSSRTCWLICIRYDKRLREHRNRGRREESTGRSSRQLSASPAGTGGDCTLSAGVGRSHYPGSCLREALSDGVSGLLRVVYGLERGAADAVSLGLVAGAGRGSATGWL